jgi:predicted O-linked N-acetylglucosamine transferase (SPINDLY family)
METNQQRVNRAKDYYNNEKYDLFLPLAELLISENIILEFLYQALSNVYCINKEYVKAYNLNKVCISYFATKNNLTNHLKILNKLGNEYNDEKEKILNHHLLTTKPYSTEYIEYYINLKCDLPSSCLQLFEKLAPLSFNNIISIFNKIYKFNSLYARKLLAKSLDIDDIIKNDDKVIKRCIQSTDESEQFVCILYLISRKLFYTTVEEIDEAYQRILTNLVKLQKVSIYTTFIHNFSIYSYTYFGHNIRSLNSLYSTFLRKNLPELTTIYNKPIRKDPDRIRIGFFSNMIFQNHSVCRDRLGVIKYLCNDLLFDVFLIHYKNTSKEMLHQIIIEKTPYTEIFVENDSTLLDLSLDILVFPEIGMDSDIYFMAHKRFAPIQINTWGHSETSGINTIDYYISSEYFEENENAQENYSEKLIQMKSLSTYYYNLDKLFTKQQIDINSIKIQYQLFPSFQLYGIFQNTFKYHPTLVKMIQGILEKNQKAFFVICVERSCWEEFMDYAEKIIGGNVCRIKMIEKLETRSFNNLMSCMDILIDSYPFGGCNTTLDAFHFNKIVLTLPSKKLNGRFTTGFYKKMKITEPICVSADDLIEKAVYYMKNIDARKKLETKISKRKYLLFQDQESLLEWNNQMRILMNVPLRKARTRTFVSQKYLELPGEHVIKKIDKKNLNDIVILLPEEYTTDQLERWIEKLNMTNNEPGCLDIVVSENMYKK